MKLLDTIHSREDLLRIPPDQEAQLCAEIREYLVQCVSKNGGHRSSHLAILDVTVAIEKEFDTSRDRLLFDVGHQCYVHKLLTGRAAGFSRRQASPSATGGPDRVEISSSSALRITVSMVPVSMISRRSISSS